MINTLVDYYRCPEEFATCFLDGNPSSNSGYFRLGPEILCFGSTTKGRLANSSTGTLHDALEDVRVEQNRVGITFNVDNAIENLRLERYCSAQDKVLTEQIAWALYYFFRPLLGVKVRRHLQRFRIRNWRSFSFPKWPVDASVEQAHKTLLRLCLQAHEAEEIPFVWFWPEGFSDCLVMTHDVETTKGRDFCPTLMDMDESFGIKSSFQLIPETRYSISGKFLESIRSRGLEVNVHDLNHDGQLFIKMAEFPEKAKRINVHARAFGARGFRSGALYRNLDCFGALDFSYDMSVPNTAHLDPQSGGCCTVMPYFIGNLIEIPLTTTQDYSLFHILNDYSLKLWCQQLDIIRRSYGLATFNVHPDYIIERRARNTYLQLLEHVRDLAAHGKTWLALPGDVETWWRKRAMMRIVRRGCNWVIEGPDSHRARVAYARLRGDDVEYSVQAQPSSPIVAAAAPNFLAA